jgi:homoserine kinase
MSRSTGHPPALRLRLPATSANLGPGFDAAAVALNFYLEIEASAAAEFSIRATGRDAVHCARLKDNLILDNYRRILTENDRPETPLALQMANGIPLGMGCGSSAAGRLAAIALAVHFGALDWDSQRILEEATALEGHPDNAAACWLGGFVAAGCEGPRVRVARVAPPSDWRVLVVLPKKPLSTSKARAMLPESYSRRDVVANLQAVSMLGLAFAQGRGDLLGIAMSDRLHQPYRAPSCPLLPPLLPLAGKHGVLGVALSGAGPAVLLVIEKEECLETALLAVRAEIGDAEAELLTCAFEPVGASEALIHVKGR